MSNKLAVILEQQDVVLDVATFVLETCRYPFVKHEKVFVEKTK